MLENGRWPSSRLVTSTFEYFRNGMPLGALENNLRQEDFTIASVWTWVVWGRMINWDSGDAVRVSLHHWPSSSWQGLWWDYMTGLAIVVILASVLLNAVVRPPSPKLLNAPNGLQVTAPRVQMRDGRFLAYKAVGVDRENAKHFIIYIHGYGASRHLALPISKVCTAILKTLWVLALKLFWI